MPVTFAPATGTSAHDTHPATSHDVAPVTAANLLSAASHDATACIVRSSIGGHPGPDNTHFKIAPAPGNGFVDTVLRAYTHRHALVIRPDDVWLALVSQFSFYAAAEGTSCNVFDNASGKTTGFTLEISVESDAAQPDVAKLSRRMTRLLQKTVPDALLRDWLVPAFSTTTLVDTTVSCLLVLSGSCASSSPTATQPRSGGDADLAFSASCGIPRVTFEGERADWELLLTRLDRLKTRWKDFGLPAVAWYHLLHPIFVRFIGAFDDPESTENREFWGGVVVAKEELNGSGGGSKNASEKLSGWITAFCAFSVQGTWLGPELYASAAADAPETLTAAQFWSTYTRLVPAPEKSKPKPKSKAAKAKAKKTALQIDRLDADSAPQPAPSIVIALAEIPHAYASAALSLSLKTKPKASAGANGTATTRERAYTVLAGLVGTGFSSSRDTELSAMGRNDTVRPVVAWWLYERRGAHADADAKEDIPLLPVPAPRVAFDLGPDLDRELDGALADVGGAGVSPDVEVDTASPGAHAGARPTETHEPEPDPKPVSEPALGVAAVQQSDPGSLGLDLNTPVIPQPPVQPAAPMSPIDDPHPDADAAGGPAADADADADAGGWNTVSWSTPAPASGLGFGFGSGSGFEFATAPAAAPDPTPAAEPEPEPVPVPEPVPDAVAAWGGQDAPASAAAPAEFESLAEVALETDGAPTGEVELKSGSGEEQTQEEQEQQTEASAAAPPGSEDPQPQPVPEPEPDSATAAVETPAAPTGDGEDGEGEDAANDAPAATAKAGGKNNAGGARGGKGKKKKGKR